MGCANALSDCGYRCIAVDMECQAACSGPDAPTVAQIRRLIVHDVEPVMEDKVSEVDQPPSSLAQDETST